MNPLDHALLDAFAAARQRLTATPSGRAQLARRLHMAGQPVQARPLRSWAICLRAADRRLSPDPRHRDPCASTIVIHPDACTFALPALHYLCAPVNIPWPGVPIAAAARQLGIHRETLHAWARQGKITIERHGPSVLFFDQFPSPGYLRNQSEIQNPKSKIPQHTPAHRNDPRARTRAWTPAPLLPSGEPYAGPWGTLPKTLALRLPLPDDWSQTLRRAPITTGRGADLHHWQCPDCRRWVRKVFLPMPTWTLPAAIADGQAAQLANQPLRPTFACHQCCNLLYESTERRPRGDKQQHAQFNRFIKRISAGVLHTRDLQPKRRNRPSPQ